MNTYEPTFTKRIKQRVSEEVLKLIARMTSTKSDIKKINDIDVSECEHLTEIQGCWLATCDYLKYKGTITNKLCKYNPNCYYKQLKRKEQECEELKKGLHQNFEEKDKLHLIIDRLLEASGYDTNTASAEDFEDVYENMRYEKQQLDQLKQILTEIKDMCSEINCESLMQNSWCGNTDFKMGCCEKLFKKQILQKISEVE